MAKSDRSDPPPDQSSPPGNPRLERPVTKSLLTPGKKGSKDSAQRPQPPFKLGDGQQVSLGFVADDEREYIFPWMHVSITVRAGEMMMMALGDYEATIVFDYKVLEQKGWQISELTEAIHAQTVAWLRHDPDSGMSVKIAMKEDDDEGGG